MQLLAQVAREARVGLIAEGIESEEELKTLRALRVPYGQGFLLCRPMPMADIEKYPRLLM